MFKKLQLIVFWIALAILLPTSLVGCHDKGAGQPTDPPPASPPMGIGHHHGAGWLEIIATLLPLIAILALLVGTYIGLKAGQQSGGEK